MDELIAKWLKELGEKYGDRRRADYEREKPTVEKYLRDLVTQIGPTYKLETPLEVGGTGIVFVGSHSRFPQSVVVKFNRPNLPPLETSMVENEARLLPTLSHPNIIRVLDVSDVDDAGNDAGNDAANDTGVTESPVAKLTYLVEPFIVGSRPLFSHDPARQAGTWLRQRVDSLKSMAPDQAADEAGRTGERTNALLADIAALFAQWVSLLAHLHREQAQHVEGYVYLDVKPENVLVDEHRHLTAIDFGSAERLDPTDHSPLEVFFTDRYAHQDLIKRKTEKASSNRVRGSIKRSELHPGLDYYALGASMLEILHEVACLREHLVAQLPLFRSLHFLATRLLAGQNSSRASDNHYRLAPQVFPSLREADYESLKYTKLSDAERDLEKERGRWNLEDRVPELATYSKDIVRVVPGFNTVLTSRLRGVIEHPLVARLKYVSQLGLVSLVYPTADHARYDHALGSYTYTTNYVRSLFNDLDNPVFRNLAGEQDLNAVLLASLLHDLGQYPLAHDLEEVHDRIFKHTRIGMLLLEDPMVDTRGRSLKNLIEDPKNGWGVSAALLGQILGAHSRNIDFEKEGESHPLKIDVLAAIIDGPVDADKADYIVRDSARCELPYGSQLDIERLLRVLTVAIIPDDGGPARRVTLGVYDKGLASAHAFGQARYQLLSTVYWHHTVRIAKTMLQYATALGIPRELFGPETLDRERKELEIREQLLAFVKSLVPPFHLPAQHQNREVQARTGGLDLAAEPPEEVIRAVSSTEAAIDKSETLASSEWYPGVSWTDWLMLRWISQLPSATDMSRNLVAAIQRRHLYKRIATFARGGPFDDVIEALEDLNWPDRVDLCTKLHEVVRIRLQRDWANLETSTWLTGREFDRLCNENLLLLVDIPRPRTKIGYQRPLGVVPELKEKSYHQESRQATEDRRWRETMEAMIEGIAPVRVLCHPDMRNVVSAQYSPIESNMARELRKLLGIPE